jgi:uncharacterized membrane protein YqjE
MEQVREPSVSDIVGHMLGDIQRLIRDEVRLARIELVQSLRDAAMGLAAVALAGAFGLLALAFVGVAVFYALALVIPLWAAGLTTVGFYAVLAGIALLFARSRLRPSSLMPEQTIESLQEDREWLEREREWVERQVR